MTPAESPNPPPITHADRIRDLEDRVKRLETVVFDLAKATLANELLATPILLTASNPTVATPLTPVYDMKN